MKKVLIVGSQHGNELLGEQLHAYLQAHPALSNMGVTFILANPRARERQVRFIESDMNRSFGEGEDTYERRRAAQLLRYCKRHKFDLIIDAHTTTVEQAPCIIVHGIADDNRDFLRASHIENIVVMKHAIIGGALGGVAPGTVSVEVCERQLGDELFQQLSDDLAAYALGQAPHSHKQVFVVDELLRKDEINMEAAMTLRNFERAPGGFYPVLVGENSYKKFTEYLGFKAKVKQQVSI